MPLIGTLGAGSKSGYYPIGRFDGTNPSRAVPNAAILTSYGYPSGDYWIQPAGQPAYQVYCDLTNQGGGWMLVGSGREGRQDNPASFRSWWLDAGNGTYDTELKSVNLADNTANRNPRYMPAAWIRATCGGSTWNEVEMIINRVANPQSFYYRSSGGTFTWSQFNPGGGVDSGTTSTHSLIVTGYSGTWLSGSASTTINNTTWTDYFPAGNDSTRNFSWSWSGHRATVGQGYYGFSAGASNTNGFQITSEGHAIQMVNIFVR